MPKQRNTKYDDKAGRFDQSVPLADDPDMVRLKELVRELAPYRRRALMTELDRQSVTEGQPDREERGLTWD